MAHAHQMMYEVCKQVLSYLMDLQLVRCWLLSLYPLSTMHHP